jgi:hypothetical protein
LNEQRLTEVSIARRNLQSTLLVEHLSDRLRDLPLCEGFMAKALMPAALALSASTR